MPPKPKAFVLDSWAVIAYFEDEPAGGQIADLIASAHEAGIPVFMSVVNVGEVWYITAREISTEDANTIVKELRDLRIQFEDAGWELTLEAARFKSQQKMSYADCYAAALAKVKGGSLITGDIDFRAVEDQIKIQWV
jgi:predicted nucleic acid-binding protein